ncbi:hypothetical protein D3OALGA1CA_4635 [Olavius algarvensis associated proteobacterium Delta 3]|nr:hypothetical protein D3OALGB2SA_4824 [Olavius algarvensis associated proteobacterium Delta 3]CAB5154515.1 hypothetical protein D3OALGA1CA_4635 [Olavius algarvensis associated proteobacterium Delta 3]
MSAPSVCHCLISGGIGGIERLVHSLSVEQYRHQTVGVLFGMTGGVFADDLRRQNIDVRVLGLKNGFDLHPLKLSRAIDFFKSYEIVHIHSINYVFLIAGLLSRKRMVFTFHGLTSLRRTLNWRDRINRASLSFSLRNFVQKTTTVSRYMEDVLRKTFPGIPRIDVVYNCSPNIPEFISPRSIVRRQTGVTEADFLVLCYGRLVHNKRVDMIVRAISILDKTHKDSGVKCLVIGEGPERTALEKMVATMGLKDVFRFQPFTDRIFDYINAADLCVFPSQWEAFGICAMESIALGKVPLVLEDGGGIVEIVSKLGMPEAIASDVSGLADAIERFRTTPPAAEDQRVRCQKALEEFSPERIVARYNRIYVDASV